MQEENNKNGSIDESEAKFAEALQKMKKLMQQLPQGSDMESLQDVLIRQDYLNLLANSLYAVNSLAFCYSHLTGVEMPAQFSKAKEYFTKAKQALSPTISPIPPSISVPTPNSNSLSPENNKKSFHRIAKTTLL